MKLWGIWRACGRRTAATILAVGMAVGGASVPATAANISSSDSPVHATGSALGVEPTNPPVETTVAPGPDGMLSVLVQGRGIATSEKTLDGVEEYVGRNLPVTARFRGLDAVQLELRPDELRQVAAHTKLQLTLDRPVHSLVDAAASDLGVRTAAARVTGSDSDGAGVTVAVIDTGIDDRHQSLVGQVLDGTSFVVGGSCATQTPAWRDDNGHGTHVASTIAGTTGPRGIAPRAKLVAVKVLDCHGSGYLSDVAAGIDWTISHRAQYGIKVLNLSLGGSEAGPEQDFLEVAVNRAAAAGITAVIAAGNSGPGPGTVGSPGAAHQAITVGAIADRGRDRGMPGYLPAKFSSRGPTLDGTPKPDIAAPGVEIIAAQAGTVRGQVPMSGTSMATPFVAGVAALLLAADPTLVPSGSSCDASLPACPDGVIGMSQPLKALLSSTARSYGSDANTTGSGIIDADRAMAQVRSQTSTRTWPMLASTPVWAEPGTITTIPLQATAGSVTMSATCPGSLVSVSASGQTISGFEAAGFSFVATTPGQAIPVTLSVNHGVGCTIHASGATTTPTAMLQFSTSNHLALNEGTSRSLQVNLQGGVPSTGIIRATVSPGATLSPASLAVSAATWSTPQNFTVSVPDDGITSMRAAASVRFEYVAATGILASRTLSLRVIDSAGAPTLSWLSEHTGCTCSYLGGTGSTVVGLSADGTKVLLYVDDDDYEPGTSARPSLVLVDRRAGTRTVVSRELDGSLGRRVSGNSVGILSPDGRSVAYYLSNAGWSGSLIILRDGVRRQVTGPPSWTSLGGFDGQGNTLVGLARPVGGTLDQAWSVNAMGQATMISATAAGVPSSGFFQDVAISADGHTIAVSVSSTNLVALPAGTDPWASQVLIRRDWSPWRQVSRTETGASFGFANQASVSPDGNLVAFSATRTTANNDPPDLYLYNLNTGQLSLVAKDSGTQLPLNLADRAAFSQNGRYLVHTNSGALADDDTNSTPDIYLYDLVTGGQSPVSLRSDGSWAGGGTFGSHQPFVSADGRVVAFTNDTGGRALIGGEDGSLSPADTDYNPDAYLVEQPDVAATSGKITLANTVVLRPDAPLTAGQARSITLSPPPDAVAAIITVSVEGTASPGFLAAWSGPANTAPGTSLVNWDHAGARATSTGIVPIIGSAIKVLSSTTARATVAVTGWLGPSGIGLTSITPIRPVDTRDTRTPLSRWTFTNFAVNSPVSTSGTQATFTVTNTTGAGVLLAGDRTVASWDRAGATVTASAFVPLNGGTIRVLSTVSADLVIDINGWLTPTGTALTTRVGRRVFDSRSGLGGSTWFLAPSRANRVSAGGTVPAGAQAAIVTFTVVNPTAGGYLALYSGTPPTSSLMAWDRPWSLASNTVVVPLESDGSFKVTANVPTFLIADVVGYVLSQN